MLTKEKPIAELVSQTNSLHDFVTCKEGELSIWKETEGVTLRDYKFFLETSKRELKKAGEDFPKTKEEIVALRKLLGKFGWEHSNVLVLLTPVDKVSEEWKVWGKTVEQSQKKLEKDPSQSNLVRVDKNFVGYINFIKQSLNQLKSVCDVSPLKKEWLKEADILSLELHCEHQIVLENWKKVGSAVTA